MVIGLCLQTGLLLLMIWIANWNKEVSFIYQLAVSAHRKEDSI